MMTRRALVTAGAIGAAMTGSPRTAEADALGAVVADGSGGGAGQTTEVLTVQALRDITGELEELRRLLREALVGPSLANGAVVDLRRQFTLFLRSNQKFPDYCEIGSSVFMDAYDWHVRHGQPLEVTRTDGRLAIRFMFTWLVMRPEQDPNFIGIPFDRG